MRPLAVITFALILAPVVAQADIYRWVDETGEVHYSDRPVEGAELITTSNPRPPSPNDDNDVARRVATRAPSGNVPNEAQVERNAQSAVAQDVATQRAKQCTEARDRYQKSIQARRIYRTSATGAREFLSDAEADKLRVENRAAMDSACGTTTAAR